jgi:amino acid adenylation domain-containing protein
MLTDAQREALISRLRRGRDTKPGGVTRRQDGLAELPLSYGQEQLWFVDRFAPGKPVYNIPLAIAIRGPLELAALGRALDHLVARHETLRTRLASGSSGRPAQIIDPPSAQPRELTDLSALKPPQRQASLMRIIGARAHEPFVLATDRLLRTSVLKLADREHVLLIVVHHAVFDGWSAGVLVREIAALYRQEATGTPAGLAPLPVQFADYAIWERDRLAGPMLAELECYWQQVMDGFETVAFPADRPRPVLDDFDGGLVQQMTCPGLLEDLRELSRREGTTLFVTLMAALHALIYRYTGQADLVIGTVSANRARPELAPLIGFLVNTLPIRADLSGDPPFTDLLAQVHRATIGAYAHQDLPFATIVETLAVERDPSRAPVFQIALVHAERDTAAIAAAGAEFALTDLAVGINAAKFDLGLLAEARADGLWLECSYKTALFDHATIARLVAHYEVLLRGVAADPAARLSALPVLTPAELRRVVTDWNDTAGPVPAGCVHHGFESQAAATPDAIAAEFEAKQVSYAELNQQANQIARRLRALGVGQEVLVGVCMATGPRRLAALFGIWKAGGGYVPLDPALPASRLGYLAADAAMPVILTDLTSAAKVPDGITAQVLCLDTGWDQIAALDGTNLADVPADPAGVAYVIYTSGSTGKPKGVLIEHRQVTNMVAGLVGNWQIGPADAVLAYASLSFDVSVLDMFVPLLSGARVVLIPPPVLQSPGRLAALMRERRVTFACLTPSVAGLLADEPFSALRGLMTAGEELSAEVARRWLRPGLRFANGYGPTETTVLSSYAVLDESMSPPPIGLPIRPNYRCYVLDPYLNPVPVGVTGELHIGGACVARGYLARPSLTAQRFIADPFTPGQRLYKSGDLVRRLADGGIVFVGRIDHQVKIRGLRIELGEIEITLAAHPDIAQAVVCVVTDPAGERQLAGYVRPTSGTEPDPAELRAHLAATLPGYMIPAHLITVGEFALTANGKIDRAALPAPGRKRSAAQPAAPATLTETTLVELYAAVLGRSQIGAADGFFDVGGSSLQVMRLIDLVGRETGVDIGAATVFLYPSPRQLATHIDAIRSGSGQAAGTGPLVELSTGGGLPLFMIHPIGGTVFGYARLAGELGGAFRVRGLQAPGLADGSRITASLADLVTDYTERIRAAQPAGPYRLSGWSMGGVIAFEIARRLEQAGAEVAMLALLDAPFAVPRDYLPAQPQLAGRFLADVAHSLGWNPADLPDPATCEAADQLGWLAARLRTGAGVEEDSGWLRRRFDLFGAHTQMIAGYQPEPPAVRAPALIVSADRSLNALARELWPRVLSGGVCVHPMDADHYTFLQPPQVADTGATILKWHAGTGQLSVERTSAC